MSRPRTPTNVLRLKGAFGKHPERARTRAGEPQSQGEIGPAPGHLSTNERAAFEEIVGLCVPGVLGASDRLVVEHGARILAALRATHYSPSTASLMIRLEAVLGRLGLSPADRSRVAVTSAKPQNRFLVSTATKRRGTA